MTPQDLTRHPCWHSLGKRISHRSGGFGDTCARCGTSLPNGSPNGEDAGPLCWEPIARPKPFAPESMERVIYDVLLDSGCPMHDGWKQRLAESIAKAVFA